MGQGISGGGVARATRSRIAALADRPVGAESLWLVHQTDPASLDGEGRADFLRLCARVEAHLAARRVRAVAALAGRDTEPENYVEAEVAIATRSPVGAAITEVHRAYRITRMLPDSLAAVERGDIYAAHLRRLHDLTVGVDDPQVCHAVEQRVLPRAIRQSPAQLARAVARAVADLDPVAFERAHQQRRDTADVTLTPVEHSMAYLTAYLPLVEGAVLMQRVESSARTAKAAGDCRPLGVLRVAALTAAPDGSGDERQAATAHGRPVEVQVLATVETMLGLAETPGELPGLGPVPAATIREMARDAALRWLTIDDSTGKLLDQSARTYRVPAAMAATVTASWVTSAGPGSTIPAGRCDLDHLTPYPAGRTTPTNLVPLDRRWHRAKTHAGVTVTRLPSGRLRWRTARGQSIEVDPYDYRL